jgi:hypothetical protein
MSSATEDALDEIIEVIAKKYLRVETLESRNSDGLDFYDCAIWNIKDALRAAYKDGFDLGFEQGFEDGVDSKSIKI